MPLLKLWNSIRGRGTPSVEPQAPLDQTESDSPAKASDTRSRGPRLTLFGGGGAHGAICKLVKPLQARIVLEVGVGDGSRAIAIMETLGIGTPARYIAIDQFEMAGGQVTLKAFHQTMRTANIRPQVFPEPIDRGLARVGNTIGAVDLAVIAIETREWQTPETLSLLGRVCHAQTVVLYQDDESWERFQVAAPTQVRRVA